MMFREAVASGYHGHVMWLSRSRDLVIKVKWSGYQGHVICLLLQELPRVQRDRCGNLGFSSYRSYHGYSVLRNGLGRDRTTGVTIYRGYVRGLEAKSRDMFHEACN